MNTNWLELKESAVHLLLGKSATAMSVQFVYFYMFTLAWVYLIAILGRRFTFVRSHFWILLSGFLASLLVTLAYYVVVWFDLPIWSAFLLCFFYASFVEACVTSFDKGRSLVDVDAAKKALFQTDTRLIRRCAIFVLTQTIFIRYSLIHGR